MNVNESGDAESLHIAGYFSLRTTSGDPLIPAPLHSSDGGERQLEPQRSDASYPWLPPTPACLGGYSLPRWLLTAPLSLCECHE